MKASSASRTQRLQPSMESPDLVLSLEVKGVKESRARVPYSILFFLNTMLTRHSGLMERRLALSMMDTSDLRMMESLGKVSNTQDSICWEARYSLS